MIDPVEAELQAYFDDAAADAAHHTALADGAELWNQIRRVSAGGKRFRPKLVLATHDGLNGRRRDAAVRLAAAVELLHTAFVIHDDVIDGDTVRRGEPNVAGHFLRRARAHGMDEGRAQSLASSAAILAGDLALTGAMHIAATSGAPHTLTSAILHRLSVAIRESAIGEMADVRLSNEWGSSVRQVLEMTGAKTAAYSFSLPLQWGALLAGAGSDVVARLGKAGAHLGLAFQLHDDLLGAFAPQESTGKSPLCDFREGKYTALIAHASATHYWPELATLIGRPDLSDAEVLKVRSMLDACGAADDVATRADDELGKAHAILADLPLPPEYRDWVVSIPGEPHRYAA